MYLQTQVKVNSINNLSDARYCAGMGAAFAGFPLDRSAMGNLTVDQIREMIEWISGPAIVGEFNNESVDYINYIAEFVGLDYVETDQNYSEEALKAVKPPVIYKLSFDGSNDPEVDQIMASMENHIACFLLNYTGKEALETHQKGVAEWCKRYPVLLGGNIQLSDLELILEKIQPDGIAVQGEEEIRPGFKDFDILADFLEALEVED